MATGTALVTGASAGLGTGFARALAAEGHDLILTARREERLTELARELRGAHQIGVAVIPADLGTPGGAETLMRAIDGQGLKVDTLINNAGFGARGAFADTAMDVHDRMLDLNCRALMDLCHLVLPGMLERRSGAILNIASIAAFQPGPWMSVYYATKAFVTTFSEGLHEEVKARGVHVACLCPGPTRTEFADVADMNDSELFKRFAVAPEQVVRDGLAALKANDALRVSGRGNKVMVGAVRFLPRGMLRRAAASLQKTREA